MLQKNPGGFIVRTAAIVELMGFEEGEEIQLVASYWRLFILVILSFIYLFWY